MIKFIVLALVITGCMTTPIQQGKDGFVSGDTSGIPISQPIVWNPEEPLVIQPAPLSYHGSKGGSLITERDQQKHITAEDDTESREEDNNEENKPNIDQNTDSRDETNNQRVSHQDLQPSVIAVKGSRNQAENDQIFPQVISGNRRLVEPQPQTQTQYAAKGGRSGVRAINVVSSGGQKPNVVYQTVQHGLPISIEEHRVTSEGVKRPVIQYQLNPVGQQVSHSVVRRPYGVLREQQNNYQYVIQPVLPVRGGLDPQRIQQQLVQQPQVQQIYGLDQRYVPISVQQIPQVEQRRDQDIINVGQVGQDQQQVGQVVGLVHQQPQQVVSVQNLQDIQRAQNHQTVQGVQGVHVVQGVHDVNQNAQSVQQQNVGQLVTSGDVAQRVDQKVVQQNVKQVPVISGQRIIGYQYVPQQQQQQQIYLQSVRPQYVQTFQSIPVQSFAQISQYDNQYQQQQQPIVIQPVQYTGHQSSHVEQQTLGLQDQQAIVGTHGHRVTIGLHEQGLVGHQGQQGLVGHQVGQHVLDGQQGLGVLQGQHGTVGTQGIQGQIVGHGLQTGHGLHSGHGVQGEQIVGVQTVQGIHGIQGVQGVQQIQTQENVGQRGHDLRVVPIQQRPHVYYQTSGLKTVSNV